MVASVNNNEVMVADGGNSDLAEKDDKETIDPTVEIYEKLMV